MKKILALALALIMLLSAAAVVHADEGVTITYTIDPETGQVHYVFTRK